MKKKSVLCLSCLVATLFFSSCETKTQTGALTGAAVGVGAGALIGGGQGALIGGAIGVIGGALIGSALDDSDRDHLNQTNSNTTRKIDNGEQLSVNDVISMHQAGISDKKIMDLIDKTGSTYDLSTSSIHRLERAGVSREVINFMLARNDQ